jgi:predicted MFS family arabinose efflux permease
MVAIPNWPLFLIPIVCAGAGFVLCHSTLQTRATETFPASRGTAVALFAFSLFLGNGLGAIVVGVAIDQTGYVPSLLASGLLLWGFAFAASRLLFARPTTAATPARATE